ncbi:hypothetical protein GE061_017719 [Apolygus lucorum]|uniref:G-protein coupled receptors family 1 profile domain-containing protein n=1 Tax=Apolygus lucorum TaxID=248454 RepID=A0A8S9XEG3_APOLU|nr:hypothetical protein GE061_017719 [Apolygus lucorum]
MSSLFCFCLTMKLITATCSFINPFLYPTFNQIPWYSLKSADSLRHSLVTPRLGSRAVLITKLFRMCTFFDLLKMDEDMAVSHYVMKRVKK